MGTAVAASPGLVHGPSLPARVTRTPLHPDTAMRASACAGPARRRKSALCSRGSRWEPALVRTWQCRQLVLPQCTPAGPPLDLTEENVEKVLLEARSELAQLFDTSVGITGVAELAELDGPFVTIKLQGRFWHERSMVLARLGNFLQKRIPEILEVQVEDPKQLDDSPENFETSP
eukprot:SM000019S05003  [mRNA]  locus=s19:393743:395033:- [translate_table: standard]